MYPIRQSPPPGIIFFSWFPVFFPTAANNGARPPPLTRQDTPIPIFGGGLEEFTASLTKGIKHDEQSFRAAFFHTQPESFGHKWQARRRGTRADYSLSALSLQWYEKKIKTFLPEKPQIEVSRFPSEFSSEKHEISRSHRTPLNSHFTSTDKCNSKSFKTCRKWMARAMVLMLAFPPPVAITHTNILHNNRRNLFAHKNCKWPRKREKTWLFLHASLWTWGYCNQKHENRILTNGDCLKCKKDSLHENFSLTTATTAVTAGTHPLLLTKPSKEC